MDLQLVFKLQRPPATFDQSNTRADCVLRYMLQRTHRLCHVYGRLLAIILVRAVRGCRLGVRVRGPDPNCMRRAFMVKCCICRETKNLLSYAPVTLVAERKDSGKFDEGNLRG